MSTNWIITKTGERFILPTPEEDAAITAAAMSDPDSIPLTDAEWEDVKPYLRRGRPLAETKKSRVSIRLEAQTLEKFRATGKGWQTRIDKALGEWLAANDLENLVEKPKDKKSA